MRPGSRAPRSFAGVALALGLLLGPQAALGEPALTRLSAGVQGLAFTGVHRDIAGSQYGAGAGALLVVQGSDHRFGFRIEGIVPVSLPQRASAAYGQATPQLSLLNGAVRCTLGRASRLWVGVGATVVNQRTPLPNIDQVVSSRLSGVRYELGYRVPLAHRRFVELTAGAAPALRGADHFAYSDGSPPVDRPESAQESDATLAWGVDRAGSQWLFGLRTIGFSAAFSATGAAADRNNGVGIMVEWRRVIVP